MIRKGGSHFCGKIMPKPLISIDFLDQLISTSLERAKLAQILQKLAWNKLIDQPWRNMSIAHRNWAHARV